MPLEAPSMASPKWLDQMKFHPNGPEYLYICLTLSQTSPGFYVSVVQVF